MLDINLGIFIALAVASLLAILFGIWFKNSRTLEVYEERCYPKEKSSVITPKFGSSQEKLRYLSDNSASLFGSNTKTQYATECGLYSREPVMLAFEEKNRKAFEKVYDNILATEGAMDVKSSSIEREIANTKTKIENEKGRFLSNYKIVTNIFYGIAIIVSAIMIIIGVIFLVIQQNTAYAPYLMIFGLIPLLFIAFNAIYLRTIVKSGDSIYKEFSVMAQKSNEKVVYSRNQFIGNLKHTIAWVLFIIALIVYSTYVILILAYPLADLLIFPTVIMCIGFLIIKYHDDGSERPPILDAEDKAKGKIGSSILLVGFITLVVIVIFLILYHFIVEASISGVILSIFSIALIKKRKSKSGLEQCIEIDFNSNACIPVKEVYCDANPDADICKL